MRKFKSLQNLIKNKHRKNIIKSVNKITDLKKDIKLFFSKNNLIVIITNIDFKNKLIVLECNNSIQFNQIKLLQGALLKSIKQNFKITIKIYS